MYQKVESFRISQTIFGATRFQGNTSRNVFFFLMEWPAGVIYRKYIVGTWSELVSEECSHYSLAFAMSIKKLNCNYYVDCWIYSAHFLSILNCIFILRGSRHRELLVLMEKQNYWYTYTILITLWWVNMNLILSNYWMYLHKKQLMDLCSLHSAVSSGCSFVLVGKRKLKIEDMYMVFLFIWTVFKVRFYFLLVFSKSTNKLKN